MVEYVASIARSGAMWTAILGLGIGLLQSIFWAAGRLDHFVILILTFVPGLAVIAGFCGLVIFFVAALLIWILAWQRSSGTLAYAALGGILSLAPLLSYMTWVTGSVAAALAGDKGTYLVLVPGLLASIAAGARVGAKIPAYFRY